MNILKAACGLSLLSLLALSGCGSSSSSSSDPVALCKDSCNKTFSLCFADAGAEAAALKAACESTCTTRGGNNNVTCTNTSVIVTALKACLSKNTCDEYTSCLEAVPECIMSGGGTGGSSGTSTGGRSGTGTGGSSGAGTGGSSGTGTACAEVVACCNAATFPQIKDMCLAAVASADEATCTLALPQFKMSICP